MDTITNFFSSSEPQNSHNGYGRGGRSGRGGRDDHDRRSDSRIQKSEMMTSQAQKIRTKQFYRQLTERMIGQFERFAEIWGKYQYAMASKSSERGVEKQNVQTALAYMAAKLQNWEFGANGMVKQLGKEELDIESSWTVARLTKFAEKLKPEEMQRLKPLILYMVGKASGQKNLPEIPDIDTPTIGKVVNPAELGQALIRASYLTDLSEEEIMKDPDKFEKTMKEEDEKAKKYRRGHTLLEYDPRIVTTKKMFEEADESQLSDPSLDKYGDESYKKNLSKKYGYEEEFDKREKHGRKSCGTTDDLKTDHDDMTVDHQGPAKPFEQKALPVYYTHDQKKVKEYQAVLFPQIERKFGVRVEIRENQFANDGRKCMMVVFSGDPKKMPHSIDYFEAGCKVKIVSRR